MRRNYVHILTGMQIKIKKRLTQIPPDPAVPGE